MYHEEHISLARKYRPSQFEDLIGQDVTITTLRNAVKMNKFPSAILLTGTRGVGKTTIARLIAKILNCSNVDVELIKSCDVCEQCRTVAEGNNNDVLEMDAASHTGVNDVREVIENARYKPLYGKYRIFIIDEVHMLSISAFNALLKTLEEPPAHAKFIFATTEINKIPLTIISRCQRFNLNSLAEEELMSHYRTVANKEGYGIDSRALQMIAEAACGSVRDGMSILDQAMLLADDKEVSATEVEQMLGISDNKDLIRLMHSILDGDVGGALRIVEEMYSLGRQVPTILQEILKLIDRILKISLLNLEDSDRSLSEILNIAKPPFLLKAWDIVFDAVQQVAKVDNQLAVMTVAVIKLIYIHQYSLEDLLEIADIGSVESSSSSGSSGSGSSGVRNSGGRSKDGVDGGRQSGRYESRDYDRLPPESQAKEELRSDASDAFLDDVGIIFDAIAASGDIELYSVVRNDLIVDKISVKAKSLLLRHKSLSNDDSLMLRYMNSIRDALPDWDISIGVDGESGGGKRGGRTGKTESGGGKSVNEYIDESIAKKKSNLLQNDLTKDILRKIDGASVADVVVE